MYPALGQLRRWHRQADGGKVLLKKFQLEIDPAAHVLVVGYGQPLVKQLPDTALYAYPAQLGAVPTPSKDNNKTCIVWEDQLPFEDGSFDQIILYHCLEYTRLPTAVLLECTRVLRPQAQLHIITPNRWRWPTSQSDEMIYRQGFSNRGLHQLVKQAGLNVRQLRPLAPPQWLERIKVCPYIGNRYWQLTAQKSVLAGMRAPVTDFVLADLLPLPRPKPVSQSTH